MYGPHGWTSDPRVREIMDPYLMEERYTDLLHFSGLTARDLVRLSQIVKELAPENLQDQQNYSPAFDEFAELAQDYVNDGLKFHGYMVTRERPDERITVEGFEGNLDPEDVDALAETYHDADDLSIGEEENEKKYIYTWWD